VFDGTDDAQVQWCKSNYANNYNFTLLISDGSYYDLSKKFGRPVFYASADIIARFKLKKVPSVISQKDKYMEVKEIAVDKKIDDVDSDNSDIN